MTPSLTIRPSTSAGRIAVANRREHPRAPLAQPVLVDAQRAWQKVECVDVSASGCALAYDAPLEVGSTVDVYFELPSRVAIEATARVVRVSQGRVALRFENLDREATL